MIGSLMVLGMSAAACGGAASSATHPVTTRAATTSPVSTSGCGRAVTAGSTTVQLSIGGHDRLVIVHVPSGYRASAPAALVLNMHGSGGTAAQQEAFTGMDATADRFGFVAAYPQALIPGGAGFDWNVPGVPLFGGRYPPPTAPDDVAFLTQLVGSLSARYCVDRRRVFATGLSGGGRMASQLACDASETFAAVAPVAGLRFPDPCPSHRPVPVLAFHGSADPVDPYNGNGQAYWTYSVPAAAQRWAVHDGCGPALPSTSTAGYSVLRYGACATGAEVELYSITSEGHEWPGGPRLPASVTKVLGPQSDALDANAVMCAFFTAHPLPSRPQ